MDDKYDCFTNSPETEKNEHLHFAEINHRDSESFRY